MNGHNLATEALRLCALCWLIAVKKQRGLVPSVCLSVCLGVVHGAIIPVISHGSV